MAKKSKRHRRGKLPAKASPELKRLNTNPFEALSDLLEDGSKEGAKAQPSKPVLTSPKRSVDPPSYQRSSDASSLDGAEDVFEESNGMSDYEVFLQSVAKIEASDVLNHKFSERLAPPPSVEAESKAVEQVEKRTMTAEEREFAIFTQEMALGNVKRIDVPASSRRGRKRKKKARSSEPRGAAKVERVLSEPEGAAKVERVLSEPEGVAAKVERVLSEAEGAAKVERVLSEAEGVAARVVRLGPKSESSESRAVRTNRNLLSKFKSHERGPRWEMLSAEQLRFLDEIKDYERRFGALPGLKLKGFVLEAGVIRFESFIEACFEKQRRYGCLVFGEANPFRGGENRLRKEILKRLKSDVRVLKFAPLFNEEKTFTKIYLAFVRH